MRRLRYTPRYECPDRVQERDVKGPAFTLRWCSVDAAQRALHRFVILAGASHRGEIIQGQGGIGYATNTAAGARGMRGDERCA